MSHHVEVGPLPAWMDVERLVGPGLQVNTDDDGWLWVQGRVNCRVAADVLARLRNQKFGGQDVEVRVSPKPPRTAVRGARTEDARRRRDTSPGFTRSGTHADEVGRFSLTPESLALRLGRRYAHKTVVDACCGVGGNAIGFARAGCQVVAVEMNRERLLMAEHNAKIYGVHHKIRFIRGDASALPLQGSELVFVDPPWSHPNLDPLRSFVERRHTWPELVAKVPAATDPSDWEDPECEAWFGDASGDRQRVKFVLMRWGAEARAS